MQYKHLIFDMDKTVTPARSPISPTMFAQLQALPTTVSIISGGESERIRAQTNDVADYILGACGNEAVTKAGELLWRNEPLTKEEEAAIHEHINQIVAILDHELYEEWTPIEYRAGTQITFSPIGNTAPIEKKMVYDPDRSKRLRWLRDIPLTHPSLDVVIGGSTSLDYYRTGCNKGAHVKKLIQYHNWNPDSCAYIGDGLHTGGNDESVIGVIETIPVDSPDDTSRILQEMFS